MFSSRKEDVPKMMEEMNKRNAIKNGILFVDEAYSFSEESIHQANHLIESLEKASLPRVDGGLGRVFV